MDTEKIRKALDHFENDEFTDAQEILKREIADAKVDWIKDKTGIDLKVDEGSTEDAAGALKAIIGTLKKGEGKENAEMLKMANGIMDYYKKEKSFAPKQAEWIANTSKALFK
jgi:hypothetical protein